MSLLCTSKTAAPRVEVIIKIFHESSTAHGRGVRRLINIMLLWFIPAVASLTNAPLDFLSRRAAVAGGVAVVSLPPRAAQAFNINTFVVQLDKDAEKRTAADFSQVVEMRPISGPSGVNTALVIIDAGNAGDFEYVWLKDAKTGKVLGTVANKAAPPPMVVKASAPRGSIVRPMAYSKAAGLWQGDPFEVQVGQFRPQATYEGRPDGPLNAFGQPIYK